MKPNIRMQSRPFALRARCVDQVRESIHGYIKPVRSWISKAEFQTAGGSTFRPSLQREFTSGRCVCLSCLLFASFAEQVREKHATRARATHHALPHKQPRKPVLTAALAVLILTVILFFPGFTSLA